MLKTNGLRSHAHFPMTPKSRGQPVSGHRGSADQGHSWGVGSERMSPCPTWGRRKVWWSCARWPKVVFCFFQVCNFDLKCSVLGREGQAGADPGMPPGKASVVWRTEFGAGVRRLETVILPRVNLG